MILKWINGRNDKKSQLKRIIAYLINSEKTTSSLTYGQGCEPEYALEDFYMVKKLHHKSVGKLYEHFVVSFRNGEIEPEYIKEIAREISSFYKNWQVLSTVHTNTQHRHIHFLVNSVSPVTGKKFSQWRGALEKTKCSIKELLIKYGVTDFAFGELEEEELYAQDDTDECRELALWIYGTVVDSEELFLDLQEDDQPYEYEYEEEYEQLMEEYNMIQRESFNTPPVSAVTLPGEGTGSLNLDIGTVFNIFSESSVELETPNEPVELNRLTHLAIKSLPGIVEKLGETNVNGIHMNIRIGCTVNVLGADNELIESIASPNTGDYDEMEFED